MGFQWDQTHQVASVRIKTKTAKLNTEALLQEAPKEKPSDRMQKPMQMQNQMQKPVDLPQQKLEKPAPVVPKPASLGLPKKPQAGHIGCDFQGQLKILVSFQQNFDVTHVTHIPSIPSAGLGLEEAFYHRDQASSAAGALWSFGPLALWPASAARSGVNEIIRGCRDVNVETCWNQGRTGSAPCCAIALLRKGFRVGSQCQGKEMRFQGHGP